MRVALREVSAVALLRVTHGVNDRICAEDGRWFIDLVSSTGAVFLGHANEAVNRHVADQLGRISCSWTSDLAIQGQCKEVVGRHLDDGYALYSLYSTGMEAAEVALRMAYHHTRRSEVVGFRHNHHGKSVATQNLTGPDPDLPELGGFHRVAFLPHTAEAEVLTRVADVVATERVAAVFVEPVQGRGGGHAASRAFFQDLQQLCHRTGTLLVCDEIFSGFHRTGPCFRYQALGIEPDIVLVGKAISNGFPAAGVVVHDRIRFHPRDSASAAPSRTTRSPARR